MKKHLLKIIASIVIIAFVYLTWVSLLYVRRIKDLESAIVAKDHSAVRKLVNVLGDPNVRVRSGNPGQTALFIAAADQNQEIVRLLLSELGADPNVASDGGLTPLHLAAANGSIPMIQLLLSAGADPQKKDSLGKDAIGWAASANKENVVKFLRGPAKGVKP